MARQTANMPSPTITVRRIRFVAEPPAGARVLRTFRQPRPCVAVEEAVEIADLPAAKAWPEPTDALHVVFVPPGAGSRWQKIGDGWLECPDQPDAVPTVSVAMDELTVKWRPGRAVVEGRADNLE